LAGGSYSVCSPGLLAKKLPTEQRPTLAITFKYKTATFVLRMIENINKSSFINDFTVFIDN